MEDVSPTLAELGGVNMRGLSAESLLGPNSSFRKHHASFHNMRHSAAWGCHLCVLLWPDWRDLIHEPWDQQLYVSRGPACWGRRRSPHIILWYLAADEQSAYWTCAMSVRITRVSIKKDRDHMLADREKMLAGSRSPLWSTSTGSSILRKMANRYLYQCIESHESCKERMSGRMPSRLLDLDAFADREDLRLVFTSEVGVQKYASLSYCWGSRVTVKLQKSNLSDFTSLIHLSELPKTIRESVEVCRGLRIRFLWIDALCIVQDDGEDFRQEVSCMGSIYAGSLFTIAAADSEHCDSGLYRPRVPAFPRRLVFESSGRTWAIDGSPHLEDDCALHSHLLSRAPLSSRAWTYQERMMAPRTIHFTEDDIIWECREQAFCPRCEDKISHLITPTKTHFAELCQGSTEKGTQSSVRHVWHTVLHEYCCTNLSFEDDRLSALAGIAQLVSRRSGYEASHGLWLPFFKDELLWYKDADEEERYQDTLNREKIPSWAWATRTPFNLKHPSFSDWYLELYSCTLTMLPAATQFDQLSSLQPTSFRVRGRLTPCGLAIVEQEHHIQYSLEPMEHKALAANDPRRASWLFYPDHNGLAEQDVICLTMRRVWSKEAASLAWNKGLDIGLVLSVVDSDKKIYRRIGYFEAQIRSKQEWTRKKEEVEVV